MADTVALQIRDRIVELIRGLDTTADSVFAAVVYPLARNALPGWIVRLGAETIEPATAPAPRLFERRREVDVVGYVEGDDLDAAVEQISGEAQRALAMPVTGPWKLLTLRSIIPHFDSSSERPVAEIALRYEAFYMTRENAPEVAA